MQRVIIAVLVLAASFSCEEVDKLLTFSVNNEVTIQIPASTVIDLPVGIPTPDVTTNSDQTFQNNNTRASLVKDVKLQEMKLTITAPTGKTFSFLKSIYIYISTGQNDELLLASLEDVPANVNNITLKPTGEKLDPYVKASSYKLRTSIITDETLTQNVDVKANLRFKVTAAPL
ncbi:hypothetical protein KK083_09980 [Fulvivirgaceae bacterium PWU4]|uniref:Uncharacterized protein n=1 Tax=Chryseosolibacter histidini TaxID=2782349 RepID=A0AAP2DKJ4_9BACT|nr:hypothetical protein [Chryseosolibacter histidini]MBT1697204.1 hypothetical protein [Chryseosolibacter histidini]